MLRYARYIFSVPRLGTHTALYSTHQTPADLEAAKRKKRQEQRQQANDNMVYAFMDYEPTYTSRPRCKEPEPGPEPDTTTDSWFSGWGDGGCDGGGGD